MTNRKIWLTVSLFIFAFVVASCNGTSPTTTNQTTTANVASPTPTPTPKPTPHPAAQAALKSLRKLASAAETGVNYQDYGSRIIDAKADIDEQLAELPEGEMKQEIQKALDAYVDAKTVWSTAATRDFVMTEFEPAKGILLKYKVPKVE